MNAKQTMLCKSAPFSGTTTITTTTTTTTHTHTPFIFLLFFFSFLSNLIVDVFVFICAQAGVMVWWRDGGMTWWRVWLYAGVFIRMLTCLVVCVCPMYAVPRWCGE